MPGYSQTELDRARQPIRSVDDRDGAVCVLGHLLTEQREAHTDERAGIIASITSAVQDFDTRTTLGTSAAHYAGFVGAQPLAQASSSPAPPSPPSPIGQTNLLANDMRAPLDPTASMHRELARQGLTPPPQRSASASASRASMEREIRRVGLTPRGAA